MAWDLRAALLKKGEIESARLMDFEFRQRARSIARLAGALGLDPAEWVGKVALKDDAGVLAEIAALPDMPDTERLAALHADARASVRADLIAEFGDPAPFPLA